MSLEISGLSKLFVAQTTIKSFLSCMGRHMGLETVGLCKLFVTEIRGMWFLSGMDQHVLLEVTCTCKAFTTNATHILRNYSSGLHLRT